MERTWVRPKRGSVQTLISGLNPRVEAQAVASAAMAAPTSVSSELFQLEPTTQVAATLKLGRTIWIIPLILITNWTINRQAETTKFPRFILFFILAIVLNTVLNFNDQVLDALKMASQVFLMLGLFCIGTQFKVQELKSISGKPLILALILWIMVIPSA